MPSLLAFQYEGLGFVALDGPKKPYLLRFKDICKLDSFMFLKSLNKEESVSNANTIYKLSPKSTDSAFQLQVFFYREKVKG